MMMNLQAGDSVRAAETITEQNFMGRRTWVHARVGELGHVMAIDGEWSTITWDRSGTTTDCHASELRWMSNTEAAKTKNRATSFQIP